MAQGPWGTRAQGPWGLSLGEGAQGPWGLALEEGATGTEEQPQANQSRIFATNMALCMTLETVLLRPPPSFSPGQSFLSPVPASH